MIPVSPPARRASLNAKNVSHHALSTLNTWRAASRPALIALIFADCASRLWREIRLSAQRFANSALRRAKPVQTLAKSTAHTMRAVRPAPTLAAPVLLPATVAADPFA